MALEFLRRLGHEYDKHITGKRHIFSPKPSAVLKDNTVAESTSLTTESRPRTGAVRPTLLQHTLRSLLHMVQFGVAYFVMLLAMYYNGYIIICILIGAFLGSLVFAWKTDGGK